MDKSSNKFAIIGGGPAGIQAALTLHRWGHNVCVLSRPLPNCPTSQIPLFDEKQRPSVGIARANIKEFREKHIQNLTDNVTAVCVDPGHDFIIEIQNYILKASHVIIATGAPRQDGRIDFSGCPDLTFDGEGRIITDDEYSTEHLHLYAVGEAASGYVRTLGCALGTGDGVARMIARKQPYNRTA